MRLTRTIPYWTMTVLSVAVGLYALTYLVLREAMFPESIAESLSARPWGIYPHALFGGIALLLGPLQFHPRVQRRAALHRRIGLTYVTMAMLVGAVGVYMAVFSYGGIVTHLGFGFLGALTLLTTSAALRYAKAGDYRKHREWVMRSFAMIFAAPTQRLWLITLMVANQGDFDFAYPWSSWLCWVVNLAVAEWLIARDRKRPLMFGGAPLASRGRADLLAAPSRVEMPI